MSEINIQEFKNILEKEAKNPDVDFINVCTQGEYAEKHIPGVRCVPLDQLREHLGELKGKKKIFIHCQSGRRGGRAVEDLQALGVDAEIMNMSGGLIAWSNAGFPTHSATTRMPLMRQVLLTAGLMVALSIVLTLVVHEYFIYLALFVGAGQMFAGLTGWCGLSHLLEKMPWNR